MKSSIHSAFVLILLVGKEVIASGAYLRLKSSQRQLKGGSSKGKKQPPPPVDWQQRLPAGKARSPPPPENIPQPGNRNFAADSMQTMQNTIQKLATDVNDLRQLLVNQNTDVNIIKAKTICIDSTSNHDNLIFSGCNVYVVNGGEAESTSDRNGKGNLIVGYNELNAISSDGTKIITGGTDRSGSHNIIVGPGHSYSAHSGIVVGAANSITGEYSSVTGGYENVASGYAASVSGGHKNSATGIGTS